jgi:hypothetical protein
MRLDAATVLLQWATGGLFFLWVTTRRREVGIGYGWLLRGTYFVLTLGSLAAAALIGWVPVRDLAAVGMAVATAVAFGASVVRRQAGVSGARELASARTARVAAMTGIERTAQPPIRRSSLPHGPSSRPTWTSSAPPSAPSGSWPPPWTPAEAPGCRCCASSPGPSSSEP